MPPLIILVNADLRTLRHTEEWLSDHDYLVAAFQSMAEAQDAIDSTRPDLVIADVRLESADAIQLIIRSRTEHPDVPVIMTHRSEHAAAEADATRYGAALIAAPLANPRFLPAVHAAVQRRRLAQKTTLRHWSRKPVVGVVKVIAARREARVVDMSYGGVQLAFGQSHTIVPMTFTIVLPANVQVRARRVWVAPSQARDHNRCGAQLLSACEGPWRHFVKSFHEASST
jgi:DNA-binding response OmpR family regulator